MTKEHSTGRGLLVGFLAGGAIGAALALLYAPKSGKELRQDIKTKSDEYYGEAEQYLTEAKSKAKELVNEGKKRSDKIITDARTRSEELLKDAEKVFSDAKLKTSDYVNTGKSTIEEEGEKLKSALKAGVDAYKETKNT